MVSLPQSLVGRTVNRMSSYAPTRGTNNPNGYIGRGLAQQALRGYLSNKAGPYGGVSAYGNDGMSDTRSGLAAQALTNSPAGSASGSAAMGAGQTAFSSSNANSGNAGGVIPAANGSPMIIIGPDGTLQLPDDYEYREEAVDRMDKVNQMLLEIQRKRQEDALGYNQARFGLGREFQDEKRGNLNRHAGRGTAFSSGYGLDVRDVATKFSQMFGELDDAEGASQTRTMGANALLQNDFRNFLRQLAIQQAFEAQRNAGAVRTNN